MVEFITNNTEITETEESVAENADELFEDENTSLQETEESSFQSQETLEQLVDTHNKKLAGVPASQEYFDETASESEYQMPQEYSFENVTDLKEEANPLAYEDNEKIILVDVFDRYGTQKEDNWWKKLGGNMY